MNFIVFLLCMSCALTWVRGVQWGSGSLLLSGFVFIKAMNRNRIVSFGETGGINTERFAVFCKKKLPLFCLFFAFKKVAFIAFVYWALSFIKLAIIICVYDLFLHLPCGWDQAAGLPAVVCLPTVPAKPFPTDWLHKASCSRVAFDLMFWLKISPDSAVSSFSVPVLHQPLERCEI